MEKANVSKHWLNKVFGIREMGVIIPLIIATVFFSLGGDFMTAENLTNILKTTSFTFITAIGMTYLMIAGGWDLSVGAVYALSGVVCGLLMSAGVPIPVAILLTLLVGVAIGSINGFFVQVVNLNPFIATMATMYMARGFVLGFQRGEAVYPLPDSFTAIGQGNLTAGALSIPYVVVIAVILGLIATLILRYTVYGRMLFAVGGNAETARLAGIPSNKIRFSAYVLTGILASLTGILMAARLGSAQPNVGSGFEMTVIAASVIGGVSLSGGAGKIYGAFLGSIFMAMISNGMTIIKVSSYWQQLVLGIVLLLACSLDYFRTHLKK